MMDDQEIERLKGQLRAFDEKLTAAIEDELSDLLRKQRKRAEAAEILPSKFHFAALNALLRVTSRQILAAHLADQKDWDQDQAHDVDTSALALPEEEQEAAVEWSENERLLILKALSEAALWSLAQLRISEKEDEQP